ncbi:formylglycine-generating enzyme family protein [Streptomyces sp. 8N616]|uniref:formylglycine-generating enzyme family protein n=1 Tax=Streptomyces sp. 8N616 TaxID=3457414 RepID=UPI003FD4B29D
MSSCCTPGTSGTSGAAGTSGAPGTHRHGGVTATVSLGPPPTRPSPARRVARQLLDLPGGTFLMGTDDPDGFPADGEGPIRKVEVVPFRIAPTTVTNAQFATFVKATSYVTDAERFGFSFVFQGLLPDELAAVSRPVAEVPWWRAVSGATWKHPEGPGSSIASRQHHPVVHVSWNDAQAYCDWSSTRLPTEAEWEYAARGGLEQLRYPWGDELAPDGRQMLNTYEGVFPTAPAGRLGTVPVKSYRANAYGLYNTVGNVWEWCSDWFSVDFHRSGPHESPTGPPTGTSRVMRGGSYLCHDSYCNRYRVAARSSNTPDSSTGNIGFRVAAPTGPPTPRECSGPGL